MKILYNEEPFPHIIIQEFFNEEELADIWKELDFYSSSKTFLDPLESGSAIEGDEVRKDNLCIELDGVYRNREQSNILRINRKIFHKDIYSMAKLHWGLSPLNRVNADATLLSYYETGHHYKAHWDEAVVTCLTHFYKEPKSFTGGDLYFPEYDWKLETENNRCIIFPSSITHSVSRVGGMEDVPMHGWGRWTMTQFMVYHPR